MGKSQWWGPALGLVLLAGCTGEEPPVTQTVTVTSAMPSPTLTGLKDPWGTVMAPEFAALYLALPGDNELHGVKGSGYCAQALAAVPCTHPPDRPGEYTAHAYDPAYPLAVTIKQRSPMVFPVAVVSGLAGSCPEGPINVAIALDGRGIGHGGRPGTKGTGYPALRSFGGYSGLACHRTVRYQMAPDGPWSAPVDEFNAAFSDGERLVTVKAPNAELLEALVREFFERVAITRANLKLG